MMFNNVTRMCYSVFLTPLLPRTGANTFCTEKYGRLANFKTFDQFSFIEGEITSKYGTTIHLYFGEYVCRSFTCRCGYRGGHQLHIFFSIFRPHQINKTDPSFFVITYVPLFVNILTYLTYEQLLIVPRPLLFPHDSIFNLNLKNIVYYYTLTIRELK